MFTMSFLQVEDVIDEILSLEEGLDASDSLKNYDPQLTQQAPLSVSRYIGYSFVANAFTGVIATTGIIAFTVASLLTTFTLVSTFNHAYNIFFQHRETTVFLTHYATSLVSVGTWVGRAGHRLPPQPHARLRLNR